MSASATNFAFNPISATFTPASGVSLTGMSNNTLDFALTLKSPLPGFSLSSLGETSALIYLGKLQLLDLDGIGTNERDNLGMTIAFRLDSTNPSKSGIAFSIPASTFLATTYVEVGFPTAFTYQSVAPGLLLGSRIVLGPNLNGNGATSTARYLDCPSDYTTLYYFAQFDTDQVPVPEPPIPEPATLVLIGSALLGLGLLRHRK